MRVLALLQNVVARIRALFRGQARNNGATDLERPYEGPGWDSEEKRRSKNSDIYPLW